MSAYAVRSLRVMSMAEVVGCQEVVAVTIRVACGSRDGADAQFLSNIDHDNVCIFDCGNSDASNVFDGGTITRMNSYAVDIDRAGCRY